MSSITRCLLAIAVVNLSLVSVSIAYTPAADEAIPYTVVPSNGGKTLPTNCEPLLYCLMKNDTRLSSIFSLEYACPNLELFQNCRNKYISNCPMLANHISAVITAIDTVCNNPQCSMEFANCTNQFASLFMPTKLSGVNDFCGNKYVLLDCIKTQAVSCSEQLKQMVSQSLQQLGDLVCDNMATRCLAQTLSCLPNGISSFEAHNVNGICANQYIMECMDVLKLAHCPYAEGIIKYTLGFCKCSSAVMQCGYNAIYNVNPKDLKNNIARAACNISASQDACINNLYQLCPNQAFQPYLIAYNALQQSCKSMTCGLNIAKCNAYGAVEFLDMIVEGVNVRNLSFSMMNKYCQYKNEISDCIFSLEQYCKPIYETLLDISGWMNAICGLEPCLSDIHECVGNSIQMSMDTQNPLSILTSSVDNVCSSIGRSRECLARASCTESVVDGMISAVDTASVYCDNEACISEVETCANVSMMVVLQAVQGIDIKYLGLDVLHKTCTHLEHLSSCMDLSASSCTSEVVNTWKAVIMQLQSTCNSLPCIGQLMGCTNSVYNVFSSRINDPIKFSTEQPQILYELCQSIDQINNCLDNNRDICPTNIIDQMSSTLTAIKPTCYQQACYQALSQCGQQSITLAVFNYTQEISENVCNSLSTSMSCVSQIKACPAKIQDMVGMKLLEYVDICYEYKQCYDEIYKCAGQDLASLMKNLQNGDVFTASYDVCKLSENGKKCIAQSYSCTGPMADKLNSFIDKLQPSCMVTACAMEVRKCYGEMNMTIINENMMNNKYMEACNAIPEIMSCVENTINCPMETINYYTKDLDRYVNYCKQFGKCIGDVRNCAGNSVNMLMTTVGAPLKYPKDLCLSALNITKCFDKSSSCVPIHNKGISTAIGLMNVGCRAVECITDITECTSRMLFVVMNPSLENFGQFCHQMPAFDKCLQAVDYNCGKYASKETTMLRNIMKMCPYLGCIPKINQCGMKMYEIVSQGPNYSLEAMNKICNKTTSIENCLDINPSDPIGCPRENSNIWKSSLKPVLDACHVKECGMKMAKCGTNLRRFFEDFGVTNLSKKKLIDACKKFIVVDRCVDGISGNCPVQLKQGWKMISKFFNDRCVHILPSTTLDPNAPSSTTTKSSSSSSTAKKEISTTTSNAGSTTTSTGSPTTAKDTYKDTTTTPAATTEMTTTAMPSTSGNEVIIKIRLGLPWNTDLLDTTSDSYKNTTSDIQKSLHSIYKNTTNYQSVEILKVFKSSVGVIHRVVYDRSLSNEEVDAVSKTISEKTNLMISGKSVSLLETPKLMFNGGEVDYNNGCYMYVSRAVCENGASCEIDADNLPRCVCPDGYWGVFCKSKNSANSIRLGSVCLAASFTTILFMLN